MASGAPTAVPDGTSLTLVNADQNGQIYDSVAFTNGGSLFYIEAATGYLFDSRGLVAYYIPGTGQSLFQFADPASIASGAGGDYCTCSIANTTSPEGLAVANSLNCQCGVQNLYFLNPINGVNYLAIGDTRPPFATSSAVYPQAVFI